MSVLWVKEAKRNRSVSVFVETIYQKFCFLLKKGKYKKQASLLGAAATGT